MKKLLYSIIILATVLVLLVGCNGTPSNSQGDVSGNAPTVKIHLPEGVGGADVENEISVLIKEDFTDNNLTSSFEIASGDALLVSVNGGSADSVIEWNGERDIVLKVKLADGAANSGKIKISSTSSWLEANGLSDYSLTHSVTMDVFYATKNGIIAYSLVSESDALEKLN